MRRSPRAEPTEQTPMFELLKAFLLKIDFLTIAELLRKRKNRRMAAALHLILVQSYEIIEVYRILLAELQAVLESRERDRDAHRLALNPARIAALLSRQSSNLEVMDTLTNELMNELRVLDSRFAETYRSLFPGKFGILFHAQTLLASGRLPLAETGPEHFPASVQGDYRTLWFTWSAPEGDRREVEKYLYPQTGTEKAVVDVSVHDGDAFFRELLRYFENEQPLKRLREIETLTERYRDILLQHFSLEDLLSEIGTVRRHHGSV
jgi:hypothetical protein